VRLSARSVLARAAVIAPSAALFARVFFENRGASGSDIAPLKPQWPLTRFGFEKLVSLGDVLISFRVEEEVRLYGIPILALVLLAAVGLAVRRWRPRRGPAVMAAFLAAIVLMFPIYFLGGERTDGRLVPLAFIAWLGILPAWSSRGLVRLRRALLVALVLPALVWTHWNYARADAALGSARRALLAIPPGQVVRVAWAEQPLHGVERLSPYRHTQGYYVVERLGFAPGSLFRHGRTKWHAVSENTKEAAEIARAIGAETFVVIVGAGPVRDRVPAGERVYDDGRTLVVREPAALALGEALHPVEDLYAPMPGRRRLPIFGVERPE
jgi:hypothetical protein